MAPAPEDSVADGTHEDNGVALRPVSPAKSHKKQSINSFSPITVATTDVSPKINSNPPNLLTLPPTASPAGPRRLSNTSIGGKVSHRETQGAEDAATPPSPRQTPRQRHIGPRPPPPPPKRLFTISKDDIRFHDAVGGLLNDERPMSVRSAPTGTGGARNSRENTPTLKSANSQSSPRCHLFGTPQWSLSYAKLVGSVGPPDGQPRLAPVRPVKPRTDVTRKADIMEQTDSVFLAKGRDKRLPKKDDLIDNPKLSRYVTRRHAIWSSRHRMQVKVAVRSETLRSPEHMRKLNKAVEVSTGKGKIQVDVKRLEKKHLDHLVSASGLQEEEIQALYNAYHRYDIDDSGFLDRNEIRQVLCDLGLQPRGREEKVEVHEILCDADREGLRHYGFDDFVVMVRAVRDRLRHLQFTECLIAYEEADTDQSRSLTMDEVLDLFESRLQLRPRTDEERIEVMAIFRHCDVDDDGEVNFEEFQEFSQMARAKIMMMRREEELTIAKAFQLSAHLVDEFRMDLPMLWACFNRYDPSGKNRIAHEDLLGLLIDVGICPLQPQLGDETVSEAMVFAHSCGREGIEFPHLLKLIHVLRLKEKAYVRDYLLERFYNYDKYRNGELHFSEAYQILADFDMLPRSREEQQSIVLVVERLDTDGSGTFSFDEFQDFFQRLTEQVQTHARELERRMILEMGFNESQLQVLRKIFFKLSPNENGQIQQIGLVTAVQRSRELLCGGNVDEISVREVTRIAQQTPDHLITFHQFAQMLKLIIGKREEEQED